MNQNTFDLAVLGAGAAGLTAAWQAAHTGARVVCIDRAPSPGVKVRLAGGGKGNVTNRLMGSEWYVSEQPDFCRDILRACGTERVLAMLADLRIPLEEREAGQMFCLVSATKLVEELTRRCTASGVSWRLNHSLDSVDNIVDDNPEDSSTSSNRGFSIRLKNNASGTDTGTVTTIRASRLLIALGSPAWPQIGASDYGLKLAARWGHRIVPVRPVLTPLILPEDWPLHGLAGISLPVRLSVADRVFDQALLFTHKGLSGPAVLQASCFWQQDMPLCIDFLPHLPVRELMHQPENGKLLVRGLITRYLPERLADRLVPESMARRKVAETGKKEREALIQAVHAHTVVPLHTEGLGKAEAAAGGVDTREVNPCTLESRLRPGLFFAGEVLDVTGLLGGYNLHWAWASGFAAGEHAARMEQQTVAG